MKCDKKDLLLYAVTDRSWLNAETLYSQVEKALEGGATFVQLREKHLDHDAFLQEAKEIKELCAKYQVPFVLDDDVELAPDFIEKLYDPLCNSGFQCAAGPLLEFFPPAGPKYWLASLLGGACVMLHGRKKNYVRILKTGGWSYNRSIDTKLHKIYRTESLPWTCFFIRTDVMKKIQFEDEQWSERNGYAAFEDRAMFYKLLKNGYSSCVVSDACYKHNDGQTSTRKLRLEPVYARAFNHYVFWHRYIYTLSRHWGARLWAKLCIGYYINLQKIYHILLVNAGREEREVLLTVKRGFKDAKAFVKSSEYAKLPKVIL